ncbi:MAG TPA: hypothetical protein VMV69_11770 [Pirellulales bacterium]|nr:hypothetical protein [Pirellulales bacterium]
MSSIEGAEPIADDELLYRRIPVSTGWYDDGLVSVSANYVGWAPPTTDAG